MGELKDNCFTYVIDRLLALKVNIPMEWEGMSPLNKDLFIKDYKRFLAKGIHYKYFNSFTFEKEKAIKNDIILHSKGIGMAINDKFFITLNHIGKEKIRSITKECSIRGLNG